MHFILKRILQIQNNVCKTDTAYIYRWPKNGYEYKLISNHSNCVPSYIKDNFQSVPLGTKHEFTNTISNLWEKLETDFGKLKHDRLHVIFKRTHMYLSLWNNFLSDLNPCDFFFFQTLFGRRYKSRQALDSTISHCPNKHFATHFRSRFRDQDYRKMHFKPRKTLWGNSFYYLSQKLLKYHT